MKGVVAALLVLIAVPGPCQDIEHVPLCDRVVTKVRWLTPYIEPFGFRPPVGCRPRPLSSYELAALAYATLCVSQADSRLEEDMPYEWLKKGANTRDVRERLWKEHFGDLEYALSQLKHELESQGAWEPFERERIAIRAAFRKQGTELQPVPQPKLFPDVPKDHWAALEVFELKKLGILNGYPDGRFRG